MHSESSCGWGGQEKRILLEMEAARKRGCEVHLACSAQATLGAKAREKGFPVHAVEMRRWFHPRSLHGAWSLLRRERFDLVHTHSSADSWLFGFAAQALGSRRPKIMRTRHLSTPVRGAFVYSRLTDRVLTTGQSIRRHLIQRGVNADKILSLPTGVDLTRFRPEEADAKALRREIGVGENAPLIGNVAVLRSWKGHDDFLDAAKIIRAQRPDAQFVIAGDGPQRERLAQRIRQEGMGDWVRLLGYRDDVPQILAALDLFLFTSYANEGVPQAVAQAMAMGKPVVAARTGSIEDLVEDGRTGLLVDAKDSKAMAEKALLLLRDKDISLRLAENGRAFVQGHFALSQMEDILWREMQRVLKK